MQLIFMIKISSGPTKVCAFILTSEIETSFTIEGSEKSYETWFPNIQMRHVPNLYEFFFCWTKYYILKNVGNQMLVVIDFHCIFFSPYHGSQRLPATVWLPIFFKISSFVLNRRNSLTQVWIGINWGCVNDKNSLRTSIVLPFMSNWSLKQGFFFLSRMTPYQWQEPHSNQAEMSALVHCVVSEIQS